MSRLRETIPANRAESTGLAWFYIPEYSNTLADAGMRAKDAGGRLMSEGEARVLLPYILQQTGGWFWTSTQHPTRDYLQVIAGGPKGASRVAVNYLNRDVPCEFIIVGEKMETRVPSSDDDEFADVVFRAACLQAGTTTSGWMHSKGVIEEVAARVGKMTTLFNAMSDEQKILGFETIKGYLKEKGR